MNSFSFLRINPSGRPIITAQNAAHLNHMVTAMIEASAAIGETAEDAASPAE